MSTLMPGLYKQMPEGWHAGEGVATDTYFHSEWDGLYYVWVAKPDALDELERLRTAGINPDETTRDGFKKRDGYRDVYDNSLLCAEWTPASGGLERPFQKDGDYWLCVVRGTATGNVQHGFLEMSSDRVFDSCVHEGNLL